MMKVIALTSDQITAVTPLKAALTAAVAAYQVAHTAYNAELLSIATGAGVTAHHPKLSLSDDGNSLIVS